MKTYQIWFYYGIVTILAGVAIFASVKGDYAMAIGLCNLSLIILLLLKVEALGGKG